MFSESKIESQLVNFLNVPQTPCVYHRLSRERGFLEFTI